MIPASESEDDQPVFDDIEPKSCAYHESQTAVSICSQCQEQICFRCHRVALNGYAVCQSCQNQQRQSVQTPWQLSTLLEGPLSFVKTIWLVLSSPTRFFSTYAVPDRMIRVIWFGVICHVAGGFVGWIYRLLFWDKFDEVMAMQAENIGTTVETQIPIFFASLPLISLLSFCVQWLAFHFACRIFGEKIDWRTTGFIIAYASAARVFQLIPPFGDFFLAPYFELFWFVHMQTTALRLMRVEFMKSMMIVMLAFFASFWFMI